MKAAEITPETAFTLTRGKLDDRELALLKNVLDIEIAEDGMTVERCTVDTDRLLRAITLYDSIRWFRYDWRRGRLGLDE